jgi:hypothetical protein
VTLRHLEQAYDNRCEPWPRSIPKELEIDALIDALIDGPGDCFEITAPEPFVEEISSVSVAGA